jgi:hypothetical protein
MTTIEKENTPTLWTVSRASAEGSEWEGAYRGTLIRLTRVTDFNVWPGQNRLGEKDATETRWDGYVADGLDGLAVRWSLVAEYHGRRKDALAEVVRYIERKFATPDPGVEA